MFLRIMFDAQLRPCAVALGLDPTALELGNSPTVPSLATIATAALRQKLAADLAAIRREGRSPVVPDSMPAQVRTSVVGYSNRLSEVPFKHRLSSCMLERLTHV
jgi:hypothetical protein